MPARMRFPAQALEELRKADPETQVSLKLIRRLIHTGAVDVYKRQRPYRVHDRTGAGRAGPDGKAFHGRVFD